MGVSCLHSSTCRWRVFRSAEVGTGRDSRIGNKGEGEAEGRVEEEEEVDRGGKEEEEAAGEATKEKGARR